MGTLSGTATAASATGVVASTGSYTLNEDGSINERNRDRFITTAGIGSATTGTSAVKNLIVTNKIRNDYEYKSACNECQVAFIDSLDDDKLAKFEMMLEAKEIPVEENNSPKTM